MILHSVWYSQLQKKFPKIESIRSIEYCYDSCFPFFPLQFLNVYPFPASYCCLFPSTVLKCGFHPNITYFFKILSDSISAHTPGVPHTWDCDFCACSWSHNRWMEEIRLLRISQCFPRMHNLLDEHTCNQHDLLWTWLFPLGMVLVLSIMCFASITS